MTDFHYYYPYVEVDLEVSVKQGELETPKRILLKNGIENRAITDVSRSSLNYRCRLSEVRRRNVDSDRLARVFFFNFDSVCGYPVCSSQFRFDFLSRVLAVEKIRTRRRVDCTHRVPVFDPRRIGHQNV